MVEAAEDTRAGRGRVVEGRLSRPGTRLAPHCSPVAPSLSATVSRGEAAAWGWGSRGKVDKAGGERRPREHHDARECRGGGRKGGRGPAPAPSSVTLVGGGEEAVERRRRRSQGREVGEDEGGRR